MADPRLTIQVDANTQAATQKLKTFQGTFTELNNAVQLATTTFQAIGRVAQEAFEFGRRGAIVTQTTESFDLLLEKVEASPGLFRELKEAAGGTISDLELMSATSTLLAGAQGDLATNLANATPQLLEIARAANKLNPSLGDTAFLYESLATGIKRSSPLILDNLGLTIKIGEANEAYADQLGKSVDELSAAERQQALLNDALRAGAVLIEQAGGAAGSAVDDYDRLTVAWENLTNTAATFVDNAAESSGVIDQVTGDLSNWDTLLGAVDAGLISGSEAIGVFVASGLGFNTAADEAFQTLTLLDRELATYLGHVERHRVLTQFAESTEEVGDAAGYTETEVRNLAREVGITGEALDDANPQAAQMATNLEQIQSGAEEAAPAVEELAESFGILDANLNIENSIERVLEQIAFANAGGLELQTAIAGATAEFEDTGDVDAFNAAMRVAFIEAQDLAVAMGDITADEAAENVSSTLGVSLQAANNLLDGIVNNLNRIDGSVVTVTINTVERFLNQDQGPGPFAVGGTAPGGLAVVGEAGPELVNLPQGAGVTNNSELERMLAGSGGAPVVNVFLDGQEISSIIDIQQGRNFRDASGGGGFTGR